MALPKKETPTHKKAFEYYYSLGDKRSSSLVAKQFQVSHAAARNWSQAFGWPAKAAERDKKVMARIEDQGDKKAENWKDKHFKLLNGYFAKCVAFLKDLESKVSPGDYARLVQLEALLRGEATQRAEIEIQKVEQYASLLIAIIQRDLPEICPHCMKRLDSRDRMIKSLESLEENDNQERPDNIPDAASPAEGQTGT
jgi:hypothetical protein